MDVARSSRWLVRRVRRGSILFFALAACGGDSDPTGPKAARIELNLTEITIDQKESVQIVPTVVDAQGTLISGVPVSFTPSSAALITVSSLGVVTSVGPAGNGTIQVKAAGLTRAIPVTVRGVATKITVDPNPGTLPQKGTLQLVAKLLDRVDSPLPNATFTYESASTAIATVSASGLVTSVGPAGIATITARSGGFAVIVQVAVTQVATKIDVSPSPARVGAGRTRPLAARLLDAVDAEIKGAAFTFVSSAPALVTVGADGTITSVGPLGNAMITVRAQGTSLSVEVPVTVVTLAHPDGTVRTIPIASGSYSVAIMGENEGYAANFGGVVSRLDLVAGTATAIAGSHGGLSLAVSRTRREVYSARWEAAGIEVINVSGAPAVATTIPVATMPLDLLVSPDERTLYAGLNNNSVAVVDLSARTFITIQTPVNFLHLSLHPTKPLLYGSGNTGTVYELDLVTRAVRTISNQLSVEAQATALTVDGALIYVANERGTIEEVNITSGQRTRTIPTCAAWGLRLSPDDDQLFVACSGGETRIIERSTGTQLKSIPGGGARRVAMSQDGLLVLIGSGSAGVTMIR